MKRFWILDWRRRERGGVSRSQNAEERRTPTFKSLPEGGAREMMAQRLMTAQIRVDDHDREAILAQAVPEILSQPVRVLSKVLQRPVEVIERS